MGSKRKQVSKRTQTRRRIDPNGYTVGTYQDRASGGYRIDVYFPATGERIRRSLHTSDSAEVDEAVEYWLQTQLPLLLAEKERREAQTQPANNGNDPSVRDLVLWYTTVFLPNRAKPRTVQKYSQVLSDFTVYCTSHHCGRVSQLTQRRIDEWQIWMQEHRPPRKGKDSRGGKTRRDEMAIIRAWLNAAVAAEELASSPISRWNMPKKPKGKPRPLRESEMVESLTLIKDKAPEVHNLATFLAYSGFSISDAMDLRWSDVDLDNGWIDRDRIKTEERLNYPLGPKLRQCIELERGRQTKPRPSEEVFRNERGRPWSYNSAYRHITRAMAGTALEGRVTPHVYRHTFISLGANADPPIPPKVLQCLAGHADLKTTLGFYTGVTFADLKRWQERAENH
jgi:integrase